jgi:ankyrin repeat protein
MKSGWQSWQMLLGLCIVALFLYSAQAGSRSTYDVASEQTPLARAARAGELDLVEQAIADGADVNHQDELMGRTPLHWAVSLDSDQAFPGRNRLAIAQTLLSKGADLQPVTLGGTTPLYDAVWNPDLVEALLKGGAAVDAGAGSRTPLTAATYYSAGKYCFASVKSMNLLIQAGANVNAQERGSRWTPLLTAVNYGCPEMVELLLGAGADPNLKTQLGETVLAAVERIEKIDSGWTRFLTRPDPELRRLSLELVRKAGGHH